MLLNLPLELIQLVLLYSRTPDLLQVAFSSRILYEIVTDSREVLLRHLRQTPGINTDVNTDLRSLKPNELFGLLLKYASQQLYGAQFYADCKTFSFPEHAIDAKASSFAHRGDKIVVLAARGQETLHVYDARDGQIQHRTLLQSPWARQGESEILKTGFDGENGLYVLQRFTPTFDEGDVDLEHPFVKDAIQSSATGQIFFVRHPLDSPHGPTRICSFPEHSEYRPLAFAAANKNVFAISWQHTRDDTCFEVVLYTVRDESPIDSGSNSIGLLSYLSFRRLILWGPM